MNEDILNYILITMIAIIGFFVKGLISELKALELRVNKNDSEIAVISANHVNLDNRLSEVNSSLKELIKSVNFLANKMQ